MTERSTCQCASQLRLLAVRGDHQRAARRQDRLLGEAGGRRVEEGAARHRQRAHLRRAVALHEQRRRAAGRVVAGLRLALEDSTVEPCGASKWPIDAPAMPPPMTTMSSLGAVGMTP